MWSNSFAPIPYVFIISLTPFIHCYTFFLHHILEDSTLYNPRSCIHCSITNGTDVPHFTFQDHDMNILKGEIERDDLKKAVALWCERNKFQGILYPTEHGYKVAKDDEVKIKQLAKTLAEARIRDKKCQSVGICDENPEKDCHSLEGYSKDERARLNAAEFEAYHEIDSRKPEDKVLKFRVTCVRNGTHCFGSQDAAYHVGGRLQDMFHWIVDLNFYDLEIMLNIREGNVL